MNVDMGRIISEEARLIILKELAAHVDESLSSSMLEPVLESFGIYQERPWIHEQLEFLAADGAVNLVSASTVKIATLTDRGHRHLDRRIAIEGVKRPARPGTSHG